MSAPDRPHEQRTGSHDRSGRLLLTLASLLVCLLLAEGALWILDLPETDPFLQEFYAFAETDEPGHYRRVFKLMCYDSDPSGCFDIDLRDPQQRIPYQDRLDPEFERHWQKTPHAVSVRYNSFGVRDREFGPPRQGVWRIAIVGDSFTYGHGLPEPDCYPRQLESILRRRLPDRPLEVLNCGRGGYNLSGIVRLSAAVLDSLSPDVLVYGYFLNDPQELHEESRIKDEGGQIHDMLEVAWQDYERTPTRFSLGIRSLQGPRLLELIAQLWKQRRLTANTLDWYRDLYGTDTWSRTEQVLAGLNRMAEAQGCRFVMIVLPVIWKLDDYPLVDVHRRIVSESRQLGIETLDGWLAVQGHRDAELMLHRRDRHPNREYARLIAERLADALAR